MKESILNFIDDIWWSIERKWRHLTLYIKGMYQLNTQGYKDSDTWSLNYSHSMLMVKMLSKFQSQTTGYPPGFEPLDEWKIEIQKMIDGFQASLDYYYADYSKKEIKLFDKKFKDAMESFTKYYRDLWW